MTKPLNFILKNWGFTLLEDTILSKTKRKVLLAPVSEIASCDTLLAKAANETQEIHIGNQTDGRVFFFLNTNDFYRDYHDFMAKGIKFVRTTMIEEYGTVAVFEDLYGHLWDLIERR